YGNSKYGYYETTRVSRKGKELSVTFIPPGFKLPIEFHVKAKTRMGERTRMVARKSFKSPLPPAYQGISVRERGNLTQNFFLLSGSLPISRLSRPYEKATGPDLPMKNKNRF